MVDADHWWLVSDEWRVGLCHVSEWCDSLGVIFDSRLLQFGVANTVTRYVEDRDMRWRIQTPRLGANPPSFPLPYSPLSFPSNSPSHPHFASLPLEVGPLTTARGSGERCKLSQRDLGRSPRGNRIWCILALKSDIWWHRFF